jgi:glycosyltransferase involved in cell wall biosynthesis
VTKRRTEPLASALVSVIVPTRNRAGLVLGALDSVWCQTYRPIELIIVDDGSTDNTNQVVANWAAGRPIGSPFDVQLISQDSRGANAARNRGIEVASGMFVAFLDSDDRWLAEKTRAQVARFREDTRIGGVYCGSREVDLETGTSSPEVPRAYPEGDLLQELLVRDVTAPTSCWMVRAACFELAGVFDDSLPARQDWDMWIRLSERTKIAAVPGILVEEGAHSGERIRSNPEREVAAHRVIFRKYADLRGKCPLPVKLAARSAVYRRRGRVYFHNGVSKRQAAILYLMAIGVWPFEFDSYAALVGLCLPRRVRTMIHGRWNRVFGNTPLAIRSH